MALIPGTNISYGNPDLHRSAMERQLRDEDLAMAMPLGPTTAADIQQIAESDESGMMREAIQVQAQRELAREQAQAMAQAKPNIFQQGLSFLTGFPVASMGQFTGRQMYDQLQRGAIPIFDDGRLRGVVQDSLLGGRVYTGDTRFDPLGTAALQEEEQREVVMPVRDEMTSALKCPAGYVFDEQLQACRLDTSGPNIPEPTMATRGFYEMPYQSTGLLGDDYGVPLIYG